MASGDDEQLLSMAKQIKILDGDIRSQMARHAGGYPHNIKAQYCMKAVRKAHRDFLYSGAKAIRTNTYYALIPYLQKAFGKDVEFCTEAIRRTVSVAKKAVNKYSHKSSIPRDRFTVVGRCGCFNNVLLDPITPHDLKDAHRQRMRILLQSGVDILSLESIRTLPEATMLLDLMREFPNARALMMFNTGYCSCLNSLNIPQAAVQCYSSFQSQIIAIGMNDISNLCVRTYLNEINKNRDLQNLIPTVACINKSACIAQRWEPMTALTETPAMEWAKLGIRYIGGDMNVTSKDIALIQAELNRLE